LVQPGAANPATVVMAEAPLLTGAAGTNSSVTNGWGTYGSGSTSAHAITAFSRTIAPMPNGTVVTLSTSGLTQFAASYPASPAASIVGIVSAADGSASIAEGGLVSIYGQNMSPLTLAAKSAPLSTGLGNACIGINGSPIPLLYVSPGQINAQLPLVSGNETLTIHSTNGISSGYSFTVQPTAPSIFMSGTAGPQTGLPLIVRDANSQLVTPTNPVHPKDMLTIYLTGMGQTTPEAQAGQPAPSNPLAWAATAPVVTLGGATLSVSYSGLAPGEIGVYQVNATVPSSVPTGLSIPLVISQAGVATTLNVRVID
jgi:uncharacterized protein (TIGR03437 family)